MSILPKCICGFSSVCNLAFTGCMQALHPSESADVPAQSEKQYPWGPDEYPDLSACTPEQKHETIVGLIQLTAKEVMRMFYAFGLKTHIECIVVNEPTNETFEFSFIKVDAAAGSGKEEAVDPIKFHKWLITEHWEEHSSGQYWHRSKDRHQWPPEQTCEEKELYNLYKQSNK